MSVVDTADAADAVEVASAGSLGEATLGRRRPTAIVALAVVAVVLAILPLLSFTLPVVFSGAFDTPGTLQVLASALVLGGLAMSYDVIYGHTGMLSFGHALPFALGIYGTNLIMIHWQLSYPIAAVLAIVGAVIVSTVLGSVALRATGTAFAMVTLAFAEAFHLLVLIDPPRIFGREEGLTLESDQLPDFLRGVVNTRNVYWLALGALVVVYLVASRVTRSRAGRVFAAIRENEARVELLGLRPFPYKLASFVLASGLAAMCGAVQLVVVRGANISSTSATFSISIVVMVVLGGSGRLWSAALGGFVYGILTLRLSSVATSDAIEAMPTVIGGPLSQPLFVLGTLFVVLVMFAPGGLGSLLRARRNR